ncbi:MAG TPA: polysaccharide biosynthesis C-terminal domain-containing protein [Candidatus Anaerofilum faecale]|nr:polysaccharide biosynthesis C-terminal domain-containing protein [Candidatus Anaerofilum faecale]
MNTRAFFRAVLPSMLSQLLNGFFIIVDGFFIGGAMGDEGLAAINVAWPVVAVLMSTGLGIGTGGAVLAAAARGRGDREAAGRARGTALTVLAAACCLLTGFLLLSYRAILPLIGAKDSLYPLAEEYLRVIVTLGSVQVISAGLMPLLRGMGRPLAAMGVMVEGLLLNIFLDWLFVWVLQGGMAGAAIATITAQAAGIPVGLWLLLRDRGVPCRRAQFVPRARLCGRILALGASPFALSVSASVVILLTNLQALRCGGTEAVAVYAVLSYVFGSLYPLLTGVGEGAQPLISYCHGAGDRAGLRFLRRACFALSLGCALVLAGGAWLARTQAGILFGAGPDTAAEAARAMLWVCLCLPFYGIARICSSYFCATGQAKLASLLAFGEPLAAQPLALFLLPLAFGLDGVWSSLLAAYLALAAAGLFLLRRLLAAGIE